LSSLKKILNLFNPLLKPLAQWYLSKTRRYSYKGIYIRVRPGVFHPGLFFSTKFLLKYLDTLTIRNLTVLELGAGPGLISIYCYQRNANVVATDITPAALENIEENRKLNNAEIKIIKSDLFDRVDPADFDLILINPPFYARKIKTENDHAWHCGENFEYFSKLFDQLSSRIKASQQILMILSEDCDLKKITELSDQAELKLLLVRTEQTVAETNFIFSIQKPIQSGS